MDIFNSQWLIHMLAKSSKTPQGRLLSLFDILDDWLVAPDIHVNITPSAQANQELISYCYTQAKALGAANPTMLAEHIVLIAHNAVQQELSNPGCASLMHAKKAVNALILAQTQRDWALPTLLSNKPATYGIAASLLLLIGIGSLWLPELMHSNDFETKLTKTSLTHHADFKSNTPAASKQVTTQLTAHDAATMYAKYEQMRNGTCQFLEVIQIPDKDKAIYIDNVVGGKIPTNLHDLVIANAYLEKVRCNFTPMLMANSK